MKYLSTALVAFALTACSPNASEPAPSTSSPIIIYPAQKIITVDPNSPIAEAVAIQGDKIVGVDSLDALKRAHPKAMMNPQYSDAIILPGLIDPHVHMTLAAMMYGLDWIPPWDMVHPSGTISGIDNKTELLQSIARYDFYMNSKALELFEITAELHDLYEGVGIDSTGELTGRIFEDAVAQDLMDLKKS